MGKLYLQLAQCTGVGARGEVLLWVGGGTDGRTHAQRPDGEEEEERRRGEGGGEKEEKRRRRG